MEGMDCTSVIHAIYPVLCINKQTLPNICFLSSFLSLCMIYLYLRSRKWLFLFLDVLLAFDQPPYKNVSQKNTTIMLFT